MKFRNRLVAIHGSIGILVGLFLVVISLTGASIVFQEESDRALNKALWYVTPPATQTTQVSLDTMLDKVKVKHPDLPLMFVQVPKQPNESYIINQEMPNEHRLQTFINPYTNEILGERVWEYSLIGFMYAVHHDLFFGKAGQITVGITGVILLLMTITGILMWNGWRKLINGFKIRWKAPLTLVSYDLHNVSGIVFSGFLLVTAFTGVIIVILHFLPMFNQIPEAKPVPQTQPIALSKLVQTANASIPEGKISLIEFSEHDPKSLTIRKKLPNQETGRFDLSTVELDRYSGEAIQATKVVKAEGLFQFIVTIADLHFGTFGGLPTRILYVFVGLMPTLLLVTGLVTWKRRRWIATNRNRGIRVAQHAEVE
jgi:uncharacterized iron-regulated membrane protein